MLVIREDQEPERKLLEMSSQNFPMTNQIFAKKKENSEIKTSEHGGSDQHNTQPKIKAKRSAFSFASIFCGEETKNTSEIRCN